MESPKLVAPAKLAPHHLAAAAAAAHPSGLTIRPIVGRKDHKESLLSGYLNAAIVVETDL